MAMENGRWEMEMVGRIRRGRTMPARWCMWRK